MVTIATLKKTRDLKNNPVEQLMTKSLFNGINLINYIDEEEEQMIVDAIKDDMDELVLFKLLVNTGIRPEEMSSIVINNVDFEGHKICVPTTVQTDDATGCDEFTGEVEAAYLYSGSQHRFVPMTEEVAEYLKYYLATWCRFDNYDSLLIPAMSTDEAHPYGSTYSVYSMLSNISRKSKCSLDVFRLRRTAATRMAERGMEFSQICEAMGVTEEIGELLIWSDKDEKIKKMTADNEFHEPKVDVDDKDDTSAIPSTTIKTPLFSEEEVERIHSAVKSALSNPEEHEVIKTTETALPNTLTVFVVYSTNLEENLEMQYCNITEAINKYLSLKEEHPERDCYHIRKETTHYSTVEVVED